MYSSLVQSSVERKSPELPERAPESATTLPCGVTATVIDTTGEHTLLLSPFAGL